MKNPIIILFSLFYFSSIAQEKEFSFFGDIEFGVNQGNTGYKTNNLLFGFNTIFPNNLYLATGVDFGFGGELTNPVAIQSNYNYKLKVGYADRRIFMKTKSTTILPFIGVGYQYVNKTNKIFDNSIIETPTNNKVDKNYELENFRNFYLPVGLDFIIHKKNIGLIFGAYMNLSKHQEFGVKIGTCFGKMF